MMAAVRNTFEVNRLVGWHSVRWLALLFCCAALGGLLLIFTYCSPWFKSVFFTTNSPSGAYEVKLKGDKGRPILLTNQVWADVFKTGHPFISDIWLHSTPDALDLSFEAGYPDVRWLSENVVEFYRKEHYDWGKDSLVLTNQAAKSIQWLRIQSFNKVLVLEMQADSSITVDLPAPRGDSQWIAAEGLFTDGQKIDFKPATFDRKNSQSNHHIYRILITDSGLRY